MTLYFVNASKRCFYHLMIFCIWRANINKKYRKDYVATFRYGRSCIRCTLSLCTRRQYESCTQQCNPNSQDFRRDSRLLPLPQRDQVAIAIRPGTRCSPQVGCAPHPRWIIRQTCDLCTDREGLVFWRFTVVSFSRPLIGWLGGILTHPESTVGTRGNPVSLLRLGHSVFCCLSFR